MKTKFLAVPYIVWMGIFVVAPIILVVVYAFTTSGGQFTLENFSNMETYISVFVRSFILAIISTGVCLIIGYPMSFILAREGQRLQKIMIMITRQYLQTMVWNGANLK